MGFLSFIRRGALVRKPEAPVSVLGYGIEVAGAVRATGPVRIDGLVCGDVSGEADLVVGEAGRVHGTIAAPRVTVAGHVQGDVIAARTMVVTASAIIEGDVRTDSRSRKEHA